MGSFWGKVEFTLEFWRNGFVEFSRMRHFAPEFVCIHARNRYGLHVLLRVPRPLCGLLLDLRKTHSPYLLLRIVTRSPIHIDRFGGPTRRRYF
jgi:hypothetical protein